MTEDKWMDAYGMSTCVNHPEKIAYSPDGFLPPLCPDCRHGPLPENWFQWPLAPHYPETSELAETGAAANGEPPVVALCGSTRFMAQLARAAREETVTGRIVVRPECDLRRPDSMWPPDQVDELKVRLDELHRAKIRIADEVLVVAPGGYIGPSTRAEIDYAEEIGRTVRYWRPSPATAAPGVPAGAAADTWWWLVCEDCGASSLDTDEPGGLSLTPEHAAEAAGSGWSVFDGVSRCRECAQRVCDAAGHMWSPWQESAYHPRVGRWVGRDCQRCTEVEYGGDAARQAGGDR